MTDIAKTSDHPFKASSASTILLDERILFDGHNDLFWEVNETDVVLNKQGDNWIITEDSRILLNGIIGKYVQCNGNGKKLTIESYDENDGDAQRWEFPLAPGFYEYICSKKYPDICATAAFKGIRGWSVIALPIGKCGKQWWSRSKSQGN
ncbi:20092_t:CDS:2 [Rhizophagus irregularis]|nr:20092_t:CDS:2 [Rhizophagus irregularis]